MSAEGAAIGWVDVYGYEFARCTECRHPFKGTETSSGLWCKDSILVSKTNPLGLITYRATCEISVQQGFCDRPHAYECKGCQRGIIIN